jgi:CRISPR-associated protein Csm2
MYGNDRSRQGGNRDYRDNRPQEESPEEKLKKELVNDFKKIWITDKIDRPGINYAEKLGKFLAKEGMTTSQIRNFFGEARRIEMGGINNPQNQIAFFLLKPKLAYAAARKAKEGGRNDGVQAFKAIIDIAWEAVDVNVPQHYKNFMNLLEAIIAFHKANGGKD